MWGTLTRILTLAVSALEGQAFPHLPNLHRCGVFRLSYSIVVLTALAMVSAVGYTRGSRAGLKGIWTLAVPSR